MPNALDKWSRPEYNPLETPTPPATGVTPELPYTGATGTNPYEPPSVQPPNPYAGAEQPTAKPTPNVGLPMPKPTAPLNGNTGIVPPGTPATTLPVGTVTGTNGYQPGQTLADYTANAGTNGIPPAQYGSGQVISDFMNQFTNSDSAYIQNARRRGTEQAASRGGLNSSIAAGAAERSAIEAAQPLVNEAAGLLRSREGYAAQNWINSQQFDREFNGALATMPITSSLNMMQALAEAALSNPEVFTPEIISGFQNFFTGSLQDMLSQFFNTNELGG